MDIRKAYVANKNRYDSMEYRKAGESGLYLPAILWGFGITSENGILRSRCRIFLGRPST